MSEDRAGANEFKEFCTGEGTWASLNRNLFRGENIAIPRHSPDKGTIKRWKELGDTVPSRASTTVEGYQSYEKGLRAPQSGQVRQNFP